VHGKTIVITGATSGIGEVAALRLAERGGRIVFIARDKIRASATMENCAGRTARWSMRRSWRTCLCSPK